MVKDLLNVQVIDNGEGGHRDLIFSVRGLVEKSALDTYYFGVILEPTGSGYVEELIAQLLQFWKNKILESDIGETIYLPIDFSDQYTGCLKVDKQDEVLNIAYGFSMREGWSVDAVNPEDYFRSINDFEANSDKRLEVKQQEFISSLDRQIEHLKMAINKPVILLIPEKADIELERVFASWTSKGGQIRRLGKYWIKDEELAKQQIAIYGNQAFALVLAQIYNVDLLSPDDTLIARLENSWTKRNIHLKTIGQLAENDFPVFIKPVIPKLFLAGVFQDLAEFRKSTEGLEETEEVLVSSIVESITAEARSYVMDGEVKDIALYEGSADLVTGKSFVTEFVAENKNKLPGVIVIDIAYSEQSGWFVLEFNACWGAGLNNCKADKVVECIIAATVNKGM